jgi:DNA-binding transcriptional LysR family regulator
MQLEALKTFCDLVETGSFTRAAELNFVSQSAVSQQLRGLERRYEQKLVERGGRVGVQPTAAGRLLYSESKEIVRRLIALEERLREREDRMSGTLRVATVYSVGLHALPPHLKQFLREHPKVAVQVEYLRTDRIYDACVAGQLDLGIVALPTRRPQLEILPLRSEELVLVVSPDHPLSRRRSVALAELRNEPFIAFDQAVPTRRLIDRILRSHRVNVSIQTEFDNIETIKRSVEAGLGVSIVPQQTARNETRAGTLVALRLADGSFTRSVGVIYRKHRELSPPATAFVDLLVREMGRG